MVSFDWFGVTPFAVVTVPTQPILSGVPVGAGCVVPLEPPLEAVLLDELHAAATSTNASESATTARENCRFLLTM
jgi:hypothetical protein